MDESVPSLPNSAASHKQSALDPALVKAALVVRPLLTHDEAQARQRQVLFRPAEGEESARVTLEDGKGGRKSYSFDHVPRDAADIFENCVRPRLLPNVLRGYNACVFAPNESKKYWYDFHGVA